MKPTHDIGLSLSISFHGVISKEESRLRVSDVFDEPRIVEADDRKRKRVRNEKNSNNCITLTILCMGHKIEYRYKEM